MKVTVNGEELRMCEPTEAFNYEEMFNTANAEVCVDQSTVNAYVHEMHQVWPVFEDYSPIDHGIATFYMFGQMTHWTLTKTADMMSSLF
ncbi:hypothetical protein M3221_00445 [Domibacillus indicus]|uniref:hypothetical protein n=1 Tax=Domibacillus indicus TaxID=1437523 RepID=UPI00203C1C5B|nr:hypothetical protein [Domibacillus indicus]MCM3786899.1 hypothetical protein [Domibacillus indicus]